MKTLPALICVALAGTLAACGSMSNLTGAASTGNKTTSSAVGEAKLTDAAAAQTADAATASAQTNDAAGDDVNADGSAKLPSFMDAVKAARDYTRQLLGIDDSALKTFKATVEATRALATSPADFKLKIAEAQVTFENALEAQKSEADAQRVVHAGELKTLFDGTVQVFMACGADVEMSEHQGRKDKDGDSQGDGDDRGEGSKRGRGQRHEGGGNRGPQDKDHGNQSKQGNGDGPDEGANLAGTASGAVSTGASSGSASGSTSSSSSTDNGPRMVFGNGEFKGGVKEMRQHVGKKELAESDACKTAVSELMALIPSQPAPSTPVVAPVVAPVSAPAVSPAVAAGGSGTASGTASAP